MCENHYPTHSTASFRLRALYKAIGLKGIVLGGMVYPLHGCTSLGVARFLWALVASLTVCVTDCGRVWTRHTSMHLLGLPAQPLLPLFAFLLWGLSAPPVGLLSLVASYPQMSGLSLTSWLW